MVVHVSGGDLLPGELEAYIEHGKQEFPSKMITQIDIGIDGDFVDVNYHFDDVPFQRIRRITGYLVGTLDRFNNAKRSEVDDRVKHISV